MTQQKLVAKFAVILALALSLLMAGCGGEKKTTQHKLAIFTAQADASLVGFTDATARLADAGRVSPAAAKNIYAINLRVVGAIDILRERAKTGFDKKEALTVIDNVIEDVRAAEAAGIVGLSGETKARFQQVTFFAQFTLRSIKAVIEAAQPPAVPEAQVKAAVSGRKQAGDETVWTDLVLILQTAVLRGIAQSRMTADEAFADGAALSAELKTSLNAKLAG